MLARPFSWQWDMCSRNVVVQYPYLARRMPFGFACSCVFTIMLLNLKLTAHMKLMEICIERAELVISHKKML